MDSIERRRLLKHLHFMKITLTEPKIQVLPRLKLSLMKVDYLIGLDLDFVTNILAKIFNRNF